MLIVLFVTGCVLDGCNVDDTGDEDNEVVLVV